jgi:hypothetical protein
MPGAGRRVSMIGKVVISVFAFCYLIITLALMTLMNINSLYNLKLITDDNIKTIRVVLHKINLMSEGDPE